MSTISATQLTQWKLSRQRHSDSGEEVMTNYMEFCFAVGDLVEVKKAPGAVFEVIEQYRDYDDYPMVKIKFVGPRRGIPPSTKGKLHKHFRIRRISANQTMLVQANAMLAIAVFAE